MNSILSIGHDIVEINRIQSAYQKYGDKFLRKIYAPNEINYCFSKKNPFPSLASCFAAKEAVSKAFHCGVGPQFHWKSATVHHQINGRPLILLDPLAQNLLQQFNGSEILITLTHTQSLASAIALLVNR
ncbi:MAG: holo-ACP synthase [Puniceicoccales bacterium]|jgi:holo-[acyl-carrier protein] synthase|nr:holo-ACP synthase [Puniceicoccales bacterium]